MSLPVDKDKYVNLLIEFYVIIIILSFLSFCLSLGKKVTQARYDKQKLTKE